MEHVAIVGSGITGLSCALALGRSGRFRVTLIERDPAPPSADPEQTFEHWHRPGVTHLRHSHVFLARLYNLIRDDYPDLLQALLDAGCRELKFSDGLATTLRSRYRAHPADDDMTILSSRRTTLEMVMRAYVVERGEVAPLGGLSARNPARPEHHTAESDRPETARRRGKCRAASDTAARASDRPGHRRGGKTLSLPRLAARGWCTRGNPLSHPSLQVSPGLQRSPSAEIYRAMVTSCSSSSWCSPPTAATSRSPWLCLRTKSA